MSNVTTKYAGLPGIALDQPDVFETDDAANLESGSGSGSLSQFQSVDASNKQLRNHVNQLLLDTIDKKSNNVEVINTKPKDAFNVFKGKYLRINQSNVPGVQLGFQTFGEWQINDSKELETPLQKYYRLKSEFDELMQTLKNVNDENLTDKEISSDLKASEIVNNLEIMNQQLAQLKVEESCKSDILPDFKLNELSLNQIQEQLNQIKSEPDCEKQVIGQTTYELYCNKQMNQLTDLARYQKLEQRLRQMERIVGDDFAILQKMPNTGSDKSLVEIASHLSSKLSMLDSNYLEQIDSRLTSLLHRFNQINEKKGELPVIEDINKINELYDLFVNQSDNRTVLPAVIARLKCNEELQKEAIYFSEGLSHLDSLQEQIARSMENNEKKLEVFKETFATNLQEIQKMFGNLQERLDKLK